MSKKKKQNYKKKYLSYLKSDAWAEIRNDVVEIYGSVCQECFKKTKFPQVHHLTFKNIFFEEPGDLTLLCKKCHEKIHAKDTSKFNKRNFNKILSENKKLKGIIEDALKIKELWLPGDDWKSEYKNEEQALFSMLKRLESALK